jgi:hypothetical protein
LKAVDVGNSIVLFGAALLMAVLPLLLLLSSLAETRIDDDLSRHIGLDRTGAHIIEGLFRARPAHSTGSVALGLIVAFAGTMGLVSSLQIIYEASSTRSTEAGATSHASWSGSSLWPGLRSLRPPTTIRYAATPVR